ncbi:MAG: hypothetical protein A3B91_02965 [Candidatus Yanofskybacteria bacterium RIFCSPHIGHO2_02_FULL_41_29]|uniref:Uncharacterized protein n=1 Tax=Candidatus Yanofskybacteria bacterium RIFCSPHIGHO2_01_FULL_41_53 TaxID=1802663 RepID=A0A1F8ELZ7_9BACT|nr:MAG: hypothetical protein A2650_02315 [Candidatus Yanofskybacteria bacterium RIFCSPHIGHO2_01_FULL_41_53]OGN12225.1 MAG: hypothetical protein A3B91_02965 [Candidatus Yanofskybacteria bacterium RIFCSPHIGHO2_02_FULL_41_29]OGN23839.1 MAG: hypothetical protein A2916_01245 [Candidatus Yanofskybacteria bacterium RIFCSPLOWO2_01_FULL_41_67]OGN28575.1 MAG: hypothetical protein A3H54_04950 [Candidatus Yanofskybacteria bacterium RIFCSPLOWO2_02_FULL_41_13]
MQNPFIKLTATEGEEEPLFEDKKVIGIGRETRDGVFVWWEKFDDGSTGPENEDFSVNVTNPEDARRKVLELLDERGLSEEE